jgi:hypothetical protein
MLSKPANADIAGINWLREKSKSGLKERPEKAIQMSNIVVDTTSLLTTTYV